ncbi:hypothetical protein L4D08_22510 [Photobacterium chitinilyticum]|uniref:hypothetical protein n=1 Tax=Photobacterium chitinilyticum TaxID=2485123 RepID=UPI003D0ECAE5
MKIINKFLVGYAICATVVLVGILFRNHLSHPLFMVGNHDPIVYGHGTKFSEHSVYRYRKLHTIEHGVLGLYQMKTTIMSIDEQKTFKKTYDVHFWDDEVFSIKLTSKDKDFTGEDEPDYSEAHILEYPQEQFFQIIFQDRELMCYSSLLTNSVKCIKLFT